VWNSCAAPDRSRAAASDRTPTAFIETQPRELGSRRDRIAAWSGGAHGKKPPLEVSSDVHEQSTLSVAAT
jgi:hypothetical protein